MIMGKGKAPSLLLVALWMVMLLQGAGATVRRGGEGVGKEQGPTTLEVLTEALTEVLNATLRRRTICPPPYYEVLDECFYIHQFVPLLSWEDARAFCKSAGGDLAQPKHYAALLVYLYENRKLARSVFDLYTYDFWVGGRLLEGEVRWISGEVVRRNDFAEEGEPQCLAIFIGREEPPALITSSCSQTKHYACQLQL